MALIRDMEGNSNGPPSVTLSAREGVEALRDENKSGRVEESAVIEERYTGPSLGAALISDKRASERSLASSSPFYPTKTSLDKGLVEADYSDTVPRKNVMAAQEIQRAVATTSSFAELSSESARQVKYSEIPKTAQRRRVIVREGDSLAKIIIAVYGKFDQQLLHTVLQLNPHIRDPNLLLVGQTVELPMIAVKKVY